MGKEKEKASGVEVRCNGGKEREGKGRDGMVGLLHREG